MKNNFAINLIKKKVYNHSVTKTQLPLNTANDTSNLKAREQ